MKRKQEAGAAHGAMTSPQTAERDATHVELLFRTGHPHVTEPTLPASRNDS